MADLRVWGDVLALSITKMARMWSGYLESLPTKRISLMHGTVRPSVHSAARRVLNPKKIDNADVHERLSCVKNQYGIDSHAYHASDAS